MPVAEREVGSLTNQPTAQKNHLPKTEIDGDDDFIKDLLTDLHALSATSPPTHSVSQSVRLWDLLKMRYGHIPPGIMNSLSERKREGVPIHLLFSAICIRSSYVSVGHRFVDRPTSFLDPLS